jgi:hypothetical protein
MKNSSIFNLRNTAVTCALALGSLASSVAYAQTQSVKVDVPFAFESGSKTLPAGIYTITLESDHIMLLRGTARGAINNEITNPEERTTPYQVGRVVFHKYGDHYYIREVWLAGDKTGRECAATKSEKELQMAKNSEAPSGTEVAINLLPQF